MYRASTPIVTGELKEFLNGVIFTKERVELSERCEVHLIAKIEVQAAYGNYPQRLGFVGFTIEPIFQKAFSKKIKDVKIASRVKEKQNPESSDYIPF